MPRGINPKIEEARKLYQKGYKLIDISEELGIPQGTIRSWKNRGKWDEQSYATLQNDEENECNVAKKRGAPKKNKNAVGNKGGAPKGNMNSLKHGAYSKQKDLSDEELELIAFSDGKTPYELMEDEYKNIVVKEYRLTQAIENEKENVKGLSVKDITTRKLVVEGTEQNETTTHVSSTFERIMRLESELTKVRAQKIKCITNMHKIGIDTKRMQIETAKFTLEVEKTRGEGASNPMADAVKKMEVRRRAQT